MVEPTQFLGIQTRLATARRNWWDAQQGDCANRSSDINEAETAYAGSLGTAITDRAAALSAAALAYANAPG